MMDLAPHSPRRAPTDDRRDAIARAARALIVEKGVEGLRTRDIAERVGINIATMHYHVPTKEALMELVADSLRHDFVQQQIERPREHLSAKQRMDLEFDDFREMALHSPATMQVFSELIERGRRDERIAEAILPMKRHWREMLQRMLSEGVTDGAYRPDLDTEMFALIIMAAFIGFCRNPKNGSPEVDRMIAELQRAIANPARTI
jgi:AcrR family transcriptional regulator